MTSITFSLKFQARSLSPLYAEKLYSKWIVGTNSLREENEVRQKRVWASRAAGGSRAAERGRGSLLGPWPRG